MNYYGQPGGQLPPPQMYYPPENYVPYEEKRRIRHSYNVIGLTLLILYILTDILCTIAYRILYSTPGMSVTFDESGSRVIPFWHLFIGTAFPALSAVIVFVGYCIFARYDPRELFRTENIKAGEMLRYIMIILFFQKVSYLCYDFIDMALAGIGLEITEFDYTIEHTLQTYGMNVFCSVILAPIGEELIYRGVVLRCSSKISQRFGIFFSAFIFGIMHGNPYQFLLGFLNGIILAMLTIRTGSLIPPMICHAANNFVASIPSIIGYYDNTAAYIVNFILLAVCFVSGVIVFAHAVITGKLKLPKYTAAHKARTIPILITSWSTIIIMIFYIIDIIGSVDIIETPPQEAAIAAIKIFLQ